MILLAFATLNSSTNAVKLECRYRKNYAWEVFGEIYYCIVEHQALILDRGNQAVDDVTGDHLDQMSNSLVLGLEIQFCKNFYLLLGITKFFRNLHSIWIHDSRLKELRQADLKEYKKLKVLKLPRNNIQVLEADLFKFTPNLQIIDFESNHIAHIDSNVFNNLMSVIQILDLRFNECKLSLKGYNNTNSKEVIERVQKNECLDERFLAENIENTAKCKSQFSLKALEEIVHNITKSNDEKFSKIIDEQAQLKQELFMILLICAVCTLSVILGFIITLVLKRRQNSRPKVIKGVSNAMYGHKPMHSPDDNLYEEVRI